MARALLAIVDTRDRVEAAVAELCRAGFAPPDLSIVCPAASGGSALGDHVAAPPRALACASTGPARGPLGGIDASVGSGGGTVLATGPLMAAGGGLAAAAAVGGIAGVLIGWGLSEHQAQHFQDSIARGRILLAVHVRSREAERDAELVLKRAGAHDVISAHDRSAAAADPNRP